ncbi:hypothetical protein [Microvirga aerophila]|uniref:hypothetical protein n=1 Tax=Microvirga aerophila TaxID=670291 RepID=UPI0013B3ADB0|nr:hypothetical protein [Microvirga aerophila]
MKVHYSLKPLEAINDIFSWMRDSRIDGRVVMWIQRGRSSNVDSDLDFLLLGQPRSDE